MKILRKTTFKLLFAISFLLIGCKDAKKPQQEEKLSFVERGKIPDNEIWNLKFCLTKKGVLTQKVHCGYIRQFMKPPRKNISYVSKGLKLDFYQNNNHQGQLISDEGILDEKKGIYRAFKNVIVTTPDKHILYTEELILNRLQETIETSKPVMFVDSTKTDTLYGNGFSSDLNFTSYKLHNPRGKAYIPDRNKNKQN